MNIEELIKAQIAFGIATTQTEVDPDRRWDAIKLVSEFLGRLRLEQAGVPPGFVIVPIEPTIEMCEAPADAGNIHRARAIWREMIAMYCSNPSVTE